MTFEKISIETDSYFQGLKHGKVLKYEEPLIFRCKSCNGLFVRAGSNPLLNEGKNITLNGKLIVKAWPMCSWCSAP